MKKELFFILVIVCIVTHIVRAVYEILKHKKIIKADRLSFIIIFANMLLFWRHLEETELEDRFSAYREYKKKTFF